MIEQIPKGYRINVIGNKESDAGPPSGRKPVVRRMVESLMECPGSQRRAANAENYEIVPFLADLPGGGNNRSQFTFPKDDIVKWSCPCPAQLLHGAVDLMSPFPEAIYI